MELGITTFVENTPDPHTGKLLSPSQRLRNAVEEAVLAEQTGLDVFGVGEHHRSDFLVSSPAVVLGAIAARTKKILLTSAVNVLSSDDPVRVFQDFATIDLLSEGRAEIMVGRGSFIESFPLFGYDLEHYNLLFEEKLNLLLKLRESEFITWKGKFRPTINNLGVYPRPHQQKLPVVIAVGGTPESAVRAGALGLPMTIAIIGGAPDNFVPFVKLYRDTAKNTGKDPAQLKLCINSHGYVAETSQQALDEFYPYYEPVISKIGRERGWSPMNRDQFDLLASPGGALVAGSPQQVIDKIMREYGLFNFQRFLIQFSVGTLSHSMMMKAIELFGTKVAPVIRRETKQQ